MSITCDADGHLDHSWEEKERIRQETSYDSGEYDVFSLQMCRNCGQVRKLRYDLER